MSYNSLDKRRAYARGYIKMRKQMGDSFVPHPSIKKPDCFIKCDYCGNTFYRSRSNMTGNNRNRKGTHNYCSRKCMGKAFINRNVKDKSPRWKGENTKQCDFCGKDITRPKWMWVHTHTFCNSSCFGNWKSINWVGQDNPSWNGGKVYYYGANWKRQQMERRRLDNHTCQICGVNESQLFRALDVHHIIPFRFFGLGKYRIANSIKNLISLCPICHCTSEHLCKNGNIKTKEELITKASSSLIR